MKRLAMMLVMLHGLDAVAAADITDLPRRARITIRRPGNKALFVQLELTTGKGRVELVGCQTSKFDKRCTRKRTRVPLTKARIKELKPLWLAAANEHCLMRRLPESWGKIWITDKKVAHVGPMVPSRDHKNLKKKCFKLAKFGWWLLDRYDRRESDAKP